MSEDVTPYGGRKPDDAARTNELRALIEQLGKSQRETAEALEVDPRTMRYWASANPAPPLMALYALRHLVREHQYKQLQNPPTIKLVVGENGHAPIPSNLMNGGRSVHVDADGRASVQRDGLIEAWVEFVHEKQETSGNR